MFLEIIILVMMALSALAQAPLTTDEYFLSELIPFMNATKFLLDGPASIEYAPTTPTTNARPTPDQMKYYNYYAASMYCQYQLANLSCTYCQNFKKDLVGWKVLTNNETAVAALVTISTTRKEIVVAFRGTQEVWNIVIGVDMLSVCLDDLDCDIKLQLGFYILTLSLYNQVINEIGSILTYSAYRNFKIVICGHSLGAAMARITTFFILFLEQFPNNKIELYTYGEIRNGNIGYADFMNAQNITTARVTSRADIIPHTIPVSVAGLPLLGDYYMHPQTEYWLNGTTPKFANTSTYNDPTCSDSMGPAYSLVDHFLYFDTDILVCWVDAPQVWLAIPDVLEPVGEIPPLPTKITNFLDEIIGFATGLLGPLLG